MAKVLDALDTQTYDKERFELLVVDDGSTDGTLDMLKNRNSPYKLVVLSTNRIEGKRYGNPGPPKNMGIMAATGRLLVFMDDDLIPVPEFIEAHVEAQRKTPVIGNGAVIQTSNLDDPFSEPKKVTDFSNNPFAGLNSSVDRELLIKAGMFDEDFIEYGWEDIEAAIRLKKLGLKPIKVPRAIGYHYKPMSYEYRLDDWIAREEARARMAVLLYKKHSTYEVKLMTLILPTFFILERLLTIGGWPDLPAVRRFIDKMDAQGHRGMVLFLSKFVTIRAYARVLRTELAKGE